MPLPAHVVAAAALLLLIAAAPAQAGHRHRQPPHDPTLGDVAHSTIEAVQGFLSRVAHAAAQPATAIAASARAAAVPGRWAISTASDANGEEIVPNPPGCPGTRFCGCGVSVKIFGHPVRDLYAAASWKRFPRASAAHGNVAIFRGGGHVAYIETAYDDGTALLYDPNSGDHRTRLHRVSIAGATIVSPH